METIPQIDASKLAEDEIGSGSARRIAPREYGLDGVARVEGEKRIVPV